MVEPIKKDTDNKETPPVKPDETPLADKDTSKYTEIEKDKYIETLKYENAKRRITNKTLQETQTKTESLLSETVTKLEEATSRLTELESKEKAAELKDASALEKATADLDEERKKVSDLTSKVSKYDERLATQNQKLQVQERKFTIDRLVTQLGYTFSSAYERDGFISSVTQQNEDGTFVMGDEEIILEAKQFVQKSKTPPKTPDGGPPNRHTETPLSEEINALLKKDHLNETEKTRLDELLEKVG